MFLALGARTHKILRNLRTRGPMRMHVRAEDIAQIIAFHKSRGAPSRSHSVDSLATIASPHFVARIFKVGVSEPSARDRSDITATPGISPVIGYSYPSRVLTPRDRYIRPPHSA